MSTLDQPATPAALVPARARPVAPAVRIVLGAVTVALSAQVAVPAGLSPVPFTLQPVAVLIVGGLLGARGGAAALVLYLAMGLAGLPVFAAGGAGLGRLLGPTGGYLLAFPVAAAAAGALVRDLPRPGIARTLLAMAAGMVLIHLGGNAQLAILTGAPARAFELGFVPFLTGDLLKIGLAALVVLGLAPRLRPVR